VVPFEKTQFSMKAKLLSEEVASQTDAHMLLSAAALSDLCGHSCTSMLESKCSLVECKLVSATVNVQVNGLGLRQITLVTHRQHCHT
jgi:hypothetical protein